MIHQKKFDGDLYLKCDNIEDFREYCENGGWGDEHGFKMDTGIDFEDVKNKWFLVVQSRVYIRN